MGKRLHGNLGVPRVIVCKENTLANFHLVVGLGESLLIDTGRKLKIVTAGGAEALQR